MKRILTFLMSLMLTMTMMPLTCAYGATADPVSYTYYTVDGNTAVKHTDGSCEDYITVTSSNKTFDNGKWYVVSEKVKIEGRIIVNGTANLILCDDATLDTTQGINVAADSTLNIYAQSKGTGTLIAETGYIKGAGIGGNEGESCGTVNIHGGTIKAAVSLAGTGIGTGDGGIGGSINIFDGKITAESDGGYRAGIGGGTGGRVDSITIYGGTVDAKQLSAAGAAIGGGNGCDSGDITINGGTVTAYSCGAGIGGGENGSAGNITINGGNITATGTNYGAGIGGGRYGNGGNVTINGGSVTASGYRGVGGGQNGTDGTLTLGENVTFKAGADKGSIWVSGDNDNAKDAFGKKYFEATDVLVPVEYIYYTADGNKAVKHEDGSCQVYKKVKSTTTAFEDGKWYIVKGDVELGDRLTVTGTANLIILDGATLTASKGIAVSDGNTLNIYGQSEGTGTLLAKTGSEVGIAAIGGDAQKDGGSISIHGGIINAEGSSVGAGIGGGSGSDGGILSIYDGKVTAKGGEYSAAIGGGRNGDSGTVVIYGGTVSATNDKDACGIGGGYGGEAGSITINGGSVTATGGTNGASAIGGTHDQNGSVTINGGSITATGADGYSYAINNCTLTLGDGVTFAAGTDKDHITVTGNKNNSSDAFGKKYFESPLQHTHVFDQELPEAKYLKSAATCTEAAEYYKSCKCGLASETDTFKSGEALGHKFPETWEPADAKQHKHTCERCGKETEYEDHTFDGDTCTECGYVKNYVVTLAKSKFTYSGKSNRPEVTVKLDDEIVPAENYDVVYPENTVNAGKYEVKVVLHDGGKEIGTANYEVVKATPKLKVTTVIKKYRKSAIRKHSKTAKQISVSGAKGKVTYKKISGSKKLRVNATTGKITCLKHSCTRKIRTHSIKVKVTCAGNSNYYKASKIVTVTVRMVN